MNIKRLFLCSLACLGILAACSPKEENDGAIKKVTVVPSEVTLAEGATESLSVSVEPSSASYTVISWESSDKSVATISKKGTLTAVAPGSATITATIDGVSGTCKVTVTQNTTAVTGVSLSETSLKLGINEEQTLTATVKPEDAANKNVTWTSSDEKIATVKDGLVTGIAVGSCKITVKTVDGGHEASCNVTVVETPIESIAFSNGSENTIIVDPGSTQTLLVSFVPATASNKNLTWKSSNTAIATVEATGEGQAKITFTAGKYGAVEITATTAVDNRTASQTFFVKGNQDLFVTPGEKIYVGKKATYQFNSSYYTDASNVKWSTNGKEVSGTEVQLAVDQPGANEVVVSADFGGVTITNSFSVTAEEWWINTSLPTPSNPRNTYPVFNKACTRAYFVSRGERHLWEINLESGEIGWHFDLNEGKNDNGGDICVNPTTGDIICSSQHHIYCVTASGSEKWSIELEDPENKLPASAMPGCGPAMSNDCSVVFVPVAPPCNVLYAVNAATGQILDSYEISLSHVQFVVYGNNDIALHTNASGGVGAIRLLHFDGAKFSETAILDSPCADLADITSAAIDKAQSTVWFMGGKGLIVTVDLKNKALGDMGTVTSAYHWGPSITEDGIMFHAVQIGAQVLAFNTAGNPSEAANWNAVYNLGSNNILNFTHVACDRQGNAYFFIDGDADGNAAFYQIAKDGNEYKLVELSHADKIPEGQAFFNFGGGYLIGGGGSKTENKLLVRCVDAERAHSWSGAGGDVCATKNANIAYAQ